MLRGGSRGRGQAEREGGGGGIFVPEAVKLRCVPLCTQFECCGWNNYTDWVDEDYPSSCQCDEKDDDDDDDDGGDCVIVPDITGNATSIYSDVNSSFCLCQGPSLLSSLS